MKIETFKRGINKDECFCESDKNIKKLLVSLHLNDNYFTNIYFGYASKEASTNQIIFHFWYSSRKYGNIEENKGKHQLQFSFYPIKQKYFTEEIKEEFTKIILPIVKQEVESCIKRIDIIDFVSTIFVSIENGKLIVTKQNK